jgi:uncharacterized iron-regulated protein
MPSFYRTIIIFLLLIAPDVNAYAAQYARVSDKKSVDLAEIVKNVAGADVIFLGEIHDNARYHQVQLEIIRSLHAKQFTLAIGLEMFTTEDQQQLDDWIEGKLDEEQFKQVYSRNWSYGWQLYRDLFLFARDNHVPLIALNIPKAIIAKVVAQGYSSLQESEIPPKISWALNESQAYYMRTIAKQVFGNTPPDKLVARLCEAQALRNNWMAWNVAKYKKNRQEDKVVVLAGTWHAVKSGVPERLAAYETLTYKVILPELPEFNLENATAKEADYLILQ